MTGLPLARRGSRIILFGTGNHPPGSRLPPVPAIGPSLTDVAAAFRERAGVPVDNITLILDPANPSELGGALDAAAHDATDVICLYFAGHGLVGDGGELYLATAATADPARGLEYTALPYRTLLRIIRDCAAPAAAIILDCCFAGRADAPVGPAAVDAVFERAPLHGGVVLSASARDERALAVPGEQHTMFTSALIDLLRDGDPEGNRDLTIDQAYRYLSRVLPERGAPRPHLRSSDHAADLVLAPNNAYSAEPASTGGEPPADVPCPFPGLRSFGPEDTRYFFGRDDVVSEVVGRVTAGAGLIPVVGPSGCGKTSLLRAGVVPALRAMGWTVLTMTPGTDPVTALDRRAPAFGDRVVLIIDQFEELFTEGAPDADRFIERLADGRVTVLAGLRADFYGQFLGHPFLADALRERQVIVAPMSQTELRAVIERPAEAAGLRLEDGLAETVLAEAGARPGRDQAAVLPLLSHALLLTWQRRSGNRLTLTGYRDTGGIAGAVAQSAEQLFAAMDDADRQVLRDLAPRLVHLSEETEDTRRRLPLVELSDPERRVVDALGNARLVTLDETYGEFAHDAVLLAWPRLRGWLDENRIALLAAQELDDAAGEWESSGRQDAYLFRGPRLARVAATIVGTSGGVRPTARASRFLDASRRRQRAGVRRGRATLAAIGALILVAGVVSAISVIEGRSNARHTAATESVALAADAQAEATIDPGLAAQLAVAAYRLSPTLDATTEMYTLLNRPMDRAIGAFGTGYEVPQVSAQQDGSLVAAIADNSKNTEADVWDLADSSDPELQATIHSSLPVLALAPRSPLLASGCRGTGGLCLWSVARPRDPVVVATLPVPASVDGNTINVTSMAFSPDATLLAVSTEQGFTLLWSVAAPDRPRFLGLLRASSAGYGAVAFAPDGRMLAQTSEDGSTLLWSLASPARPVVAARMSGSYQDLAFNPAGTLLAAVGGTDVGLWKLTGQDKPVAVKVTPYASPSGDLETVAFSPDGDTLAFAGTETEGGLGFLATLDVSPAGMTTIANAVPGWWDLGYAIPWIAYTRGGTLLSGGSDGEVRLWHVSPALMPDAEAGPYNLGVSRTGHLLVSPLQLGSDNNPTYTTAIWDISDPDSPVLESTLPLNPDAAVFLGSTRGLLLNADGTVQLWNLADPRHPMRMGILGSVGQSSGYVASVTADTSGTLVGIPDDDGRLLLWRITSALRPVLAGTIAMPDPRQDSSGLLGDGQTAVVVTPAGMQWWDVRSPAHPVLIGSSAMPGADSGAEIEGGSVLAAESALNQDCGCASLNLFDVSGRHVAGSTVEANSAGYVMQISGDDRFLATTGDAGNGIDLWDISDPGHPVEEPALLTVPGVDGIAISAAGQWLADWNSSTLQLWNITDPANPAPEATFSFSDEPDNTGLATGVDDAAFLPSSSVLAVSLNGWTVLVDADPAALAADYCSETGGNIGSQASKYAGYTDPCPGGGD